MKSLLQYITEAAGLGKQLADELYKEATKMKLTTNYNEDCLAVMTTDVTDIDAFTTNVTANLLPSSQTYKKQSNKMKHFSMYDTNTKKTTLWVGLAEQIIKMYKDLKKDNKIKLTVLS